MLLYAREFPTSERIITRIVCENCEKRFGENRERDDSGTVGHGTVRVRYDRLRTTATSTFNLPSKRLCLDGWMGCGVAVGLVVVRVEVR